MISAANLANKPRGVLPKYPPLPRNCGGASFSLVIAGKREDVASFFLVIAGKREDGASFSLVIAGKSEDGASFFLGNAGKREDGASFSLDNAGKREDGASFSLVIAGKREDGASFSLGNAGKREDGASFGTVKYPVIYKLPICSGHVRRCSATSLLPYTARFAGEFTVPVFFNQNTAYLSSLILGSWAAGIAEVL